MYKLVQDKLWSLIHSNVHGIDTCFQQYALLLDQLPKSESDIWKVFADYCVLLEDLHFIVLAGDAKCMKGLAEVINEDIAVWPNDPLHHEKNINGVYMIPKPDTPPQTAYGISIEYPLWNTTGLNRGTWLNTCFISAKTSSSDIVTIPNSERLFSKGIVKNTRDDFLNHIKAIIKVLQFTPFIGFPIFKGESDYFAIFFSKDNYNFANNLSDNMEIKSIPHIFFFYNNNWHQKYIGEINLW